MWDSNVHDKLFLCCRYHMFSPAHLHQRAAYETFLLRAAISCATFPRALYDAIFCERPSCAVQRLKNLNKTNRVELKSLHVYRLAFPLFSLRDSRQQNNLSASVLGHVFDRRIPEKRRSRSSKPTEKHVWLWNSERERRRQHMLVVGRCHAWISNTERERERNSM